MPSKMFVNLPVKDLDSSVAFFKALGYSFNAQFSDDTAACMVISPENYVMFLTEVKWKQIIPRPISDTSKGTEVIVCVTLATKEEVAAMVANALAIGGSRINEPEDYGFMIHDGFQDLDGHLWNFIWMDPKFLQQGANG